MYFNGSGDRSSSMRAMVVLPAPSGPISATENFTNTSFRRSSKLVLAISLRFHIWAHRGQRTGNAAGGFVPCVAHRSHALQSRHDILICLAVLGNGVGSGEVQRWTLISNVEQRIPHGK